MTSGFDFLPNGWSDTERSLYQNAFEPVGAYQDMTAQALYNEGYFNRDINHDARMAIRESLDAYMADVYGVNFQEIFDWDTWREAYEGESA